MPVKRKKSLTIRNHFARKFFLIIGLVLLILAVAKIFLLKQAQVFEISQSYVVSTGTSVSTVSMVGTPSPIPTTYPVPTPVATCIPRPSCLDSVPACKLPISPNMCPAPIATTIPRPTASPVPSGCYYQQAKCIQAPCEPILVCQTLPRPSASAYPIPTPMPSIAPSASPTYTTSQVASFQASKPCGNDNYLYIAYSCKDGRQITFANGACGSILAALTSAQAVCVKAMGVKPL